MLLSRILECFQVSFEGLYLPPRLCLKVGLVSPVSRWQRAAKMTPLKQTFAALLDYLRTQSQIAWTPKARTLYTSVSWVYWACWHSGDGAVGWVVGRSSWGNGVVLGVGVSSQCRWFPFFFFSFFFPLSQVDTHNEYWLIPLNASNKRLQNI